MKIKVEHYDAGASTYSLLELSPAEIAAIQFGLWTEVGSRFVPGLADRGNVYFRLWEEINEVTGLQRVRM